jgi:hypothetical protein
MMSDWTRKTRYAGAPTKDLRKIDQDPVKVPPHKKERKYKLTVEWTETTTWRREMEYTSRAGRDEARRRIERHFREAAEKEKRKQPYRYRHWDKNSPFADYNSNVVSELKTAPEYIETDQ